MQINSITPVCFQTNRGSLKTSVPSFGQTKLSDTEKLAKALEALGNIGNALTKIGADTQAAVASLKETTPTEQKTVTKPADEKVDTEKKIIAISAVTNKIIENAKNEYRTGKAILDHAIGVVDYFNETALLDGASSYFKGYPYLATRHSDHMEINTHYNSKEIGLFYPQQAHKLNVTYREGDYDEVVMLQANSEEYEVFPKHAGSFQLTKKLSDGINEIYNFYNNGKSFNYSRINTLTKESLTSLYINENNIIEYKDKDKEPNGIKFRVSPYEECVYIQNGKSEEKVYVDDGIINDLLGCNSGINGK